MNDDKDSVKLKEMEVSRRMFLFGRTAAEDESGATAIEYGLIAGLIAVASVASLKTVGFNLSENMRCTGRLLAAKRIGRKCQKAGF